MSGRKYKTIAVRDDTYEKLKRMAKEKSKSIGDVIRETVEGKGSNDLELLKEVFGSIFQPFRDIIEEQIGFEKLKWSKEWKYREAVYVMHIKRLALINDILEYYRNRILGDEEFALRALPHIAPYIFGSDVPITSTHIAFKASATAIERYPDGSTRVVHKRASLDNQE